MSKKISSLYLHFPFCRHLCNYCDFYKKVPVQKSVEIENYHVELSNSFLIHENLMKTYGYSWSPLKTLYIGGGTPSLWGIEGRIFLDKMLKVSHNIQFSSDIEFTLEVNPGSYTPASLEAWEEFGANRFSLGVQSLNAEMIKLLDRVHSLDDVYQTLEYFKNGKKNYSVDFMIGLPHSQQSKRDIQKELEEVLKYEPSHLSVYILTVKNNYTHFNSLPQEEWIEREYFLVSSILKDAGYNHYEVSNFSKPGLESVHNLNYWNSQTVAALGPSATGFLSEEKIRYKWKTKENKYDLEFLKSEEFFIEKIYMSLRTSFGLNFKRAYLENILKKDITNIVDFWVKNQLAHCPNEEVVILTTKGYLVLDTLMGDLFREKAL